MSSTNNRGGGGDRRGEKQNNAATKQNGNLMTNEEPENSTDGEYLPDDTWKHENQNNNPFNRSQSSNQGVEENKSPPRRNGKSPHHSQEHTESHSDLSGRATSNAQSEAHVQQDGNSVSNPRNAGRHSPISERVARNGQQETSDPGYVPEAVFDERSSPHNALDRRFPENRIPTSENVRLEQSGRCVQRPISTQEQQGVEFAGAPRTPSVEPLQVVSLNSALSQSESRGRLGQAELNVNLPQNLIPVPLTPPIIANEQMALPTAFLYQPLTIAEMNLVRHTAGLAPLQTAFLNQPLTRAEMNQVRHTTGRAPLLNVELSQSAVRAEQPRGRNSVLGDWIDEANSQPQREKKSKKKPNEFKPQQGKDMQSAGGYYMNPWDRLSLDFTLTNRETLSTWEYPELGMEAAGGYRIDPRNQFSQESISSYNDLVKQQNYTSPSEYPPWSTADDSDQIEEKLGHDLTTQQQPQQGSHPVPEGTVRYLYPNGPTQQQTQQGSHPVQELANIRRETDELINWFMRGHATGLDETVTKWFKIFLNTISIEKLRRLDSGELDPTWMRDYLLGVVHLNITRHRDPNFLLKKIHDDWPSD